LHNRAAEAVTWQLQQSSSWLIDDMRASATLDSR
jgi:hypothetical protein